jgi:hypothetical protein
VCVCSGSNLVVIIIMATLVAKGHEVMKEMSEEDLQDQLDELEVFQSSYENDIVILINTRY